MTDKYFMATIHYSKPHTDKYLIKNVKDKKEAKYIAENQNADPKYSLLWDESPTESEDEIITIDEVVWDGKRKDYVNK